MMRILSIAAVLTAGLSAPVTADLLTEAAHQWRGDGKFRAELSGPIRSAKCRLSSDPAQAEDGFRLAGKCAAPSGSATLDLSVTRQADGTVAATLESSVMDETVNLIGQGTAHGVALISQEPLTIDDQVMSFQMDLKWDAASGTLTLNEWLTPTNGGETVQIVWMTLMK